MRLMADFTMRYRIKQILIEQHNMSESVANIAMLGHGKAIQEAYQYNIAPEAVAEAIYESWKKENK